MFAGGAPVSDPARWLNNKGTKEQSFSFAWLLGCLVIKKDFPSSRAGGRRSNSDCSRLAVTHATSDESEASRCSVARRGSVNVPGRSFSEQGRGSRFKVRCSEFKIGRASCRDRGSISAED